MTTPTGQISFTDVKNEFGRAAPVGDTTGTAISLGKYRVNDATTFNKPLDIGVPQSGAIKMSDLKGRTRNVIFRYSGTIKRQDLDDTKKAALNLKSVYDANQDQYQELSISQPLMIGNFITRPTDLSNTGKPVIITAQVVGILGSKRTDYDNTSEQFVALDTGAFGIGSSIRIEVTADGQIYGAGGQGGKGSNSSGEGGNATNGTTAIGVRSGNASVKIINSGYIQCGFAGGGGGGGTGDNPSKSFVDPYISGGGGGGGAGFPPGLGGTAGTGSDDGSDGAVGQTAASQTRGSGGAGGGPDEGSSNPGDGGDGGDNNVAAQDGDSGTGGNLSNGSGGSAGSNGAAIRQQTGGATFTITNSGTLIGSTNEDGFTGN
tara:strand:- start:480 stop:1604 length:1125 start_codon:yes stop_codon:yes gene_type:complete